MIDEKEYSFSYDAKCTISGSVRARSLQEAVEKVLNHNDPDISDVDMDVPYSFSSMGFKEKAYELGIQEEKPIKSKYRAVVKDFK